MGFLEELGRRAAEANRTIVLAEGQDPRVREAAARLREQVDLAPVVLVPDAGAAGAFGPAADVRIATEVGAQDRYARLYRELWAEEEPADEMIEAALRDPIVLAGLMVAAGDADGAVAGAVTSTAAVIRVAIRSLGLASGVQTVSGAFYMVARPFRGTEGPEVLTFVDSGVVPDPDADQLVEIAAQAARMRRIIVGDEPRVAFLSYSTRGSAGGVSVERMRQALQLFQMAYPDVDSDGELQVDAALIDEVARRKAPDSAVAGRANVLVFPDLNAGNIAYKLVERLAGAAAIGPVLHGLARPFNDLSRGTSVDGVVWVACVTALMADDS